MTCKDGTCKGQGLSTLLVCKTHHRSENLAYQPERSTSARVCTPARGYHLRDYAFHYANAAASFQTLSCTLLKPSRLHGPSRSQPLELVWTHSRKCPDAGEEDDKPVMQHCRCRWLRALVGLHRSSIVSAKRHSEPKAQL